MDETEGFQCLIHSNWTICCLFSPFSLYKRKKVYKFWNPKAPRSLKILTQNLRVVIGLDLTWERKDVFFGGSDQGQVGGQHVPLLGHGEALES